MNNRPFLLAVFTFLTLFYLATSACSNTKPHPQGESNTDTLQTLTAEQVDQAVTVSDPADDSYRSSSVYINNVQKVRYDGDLYIWINGSFANGCTKLLNVDYEIVDQQTLALSMDGWAPTDQICTQALVPFTYLLEDLEGEAIQKLTHYKADGQIHEL